MSEYPDPDEEFELMYGDELELLREQDDYEDPDIEPTRKSRRSLNFNTPSTSKSASHSDNLNTTLQDDFHALDTGSANKTCSPTSQLFDSCKSQSIENNQTNDKVVVQHEENLNTKKRSIHDLFGDIDDLLSEGNEPRLKRSKDDKEADLELIDYIVELRKQYQKRQTVAAIIRGPSSFNDADRDKRNLSYSVPKYPFIGVKRHDGEKVYVRFHSEDFEKEERERLIKDCSFEGVFGNTFKSVWSEARELINKEMDNEQIKHTESNNDAIEETDINKQLWVDLYKPKKYLELLSDESTNRTMLRWMKLWDKVVFNRRPKIKQVKPDADPKAKFFKKQELSTKLDEHGRPENKVALLCGPPGLGKTTLAHMVAKHAGYNVVEINASDDRSLTSFKTALETATQMRSVVDQEKRPNCLVFDEIDGAPQASIDFLIKFISGTGNEKPKKGQAKKQNILKRPIICICNDVYVPALRPLRQIAFVVNFPKTSSARLAERLMEIARREQIKTDLGAMMALAEKSNNDIRSCLSVLHFFKMLNKQVTLSDIYRASVGQKDMQKSLFEVWEEIFRIQKQKTKFSCDGTNKDIGLKSRMEGVLHTITAFGDYERMAQGVFENYPLINFKDPKLLGTCEALEWFAFTDCVNNQIHALQNYSLGSFLPYAFVMWHFVFSTVQKPKLQFPSAAFEATSKENRRKAIVSEVLRGMHPSVRCYCHPMNLVQDTLPLLTIIIVPPFRPVNFHLYSPEEKESLLRVVKIMVEYSLNYVQERTSDGTYVFNLEPNVEEVVTFNKLETKKRAVSYFNKQLIAREIEAEKMRRFEGPSFEDDGKKTEETSKRQTCAVTDKSGVSPSQLPNHLQTLKAKSVKPKLDQSIKKDFFGRIITSSTSPRGKSNSVLRNDIWFRYKEGYNNAVRKKVYMSQLK